ncbi:hypothetical protein A2U01_0077445, partial [Trifolium medium]|nr:hypothetical protein [Trifolium medium]
LKLQLHVLQHNLVSGLTNSNT